MPPINWFSTGVNTQRRHLFCNQLIKILKFERSSSAFLKPMMEAGVIRPSINRLYH